MQQLIEFHKVSIDGKSYQQTVDARALHAKLEVGKDFSSWIKAQIQRTRLVEFKDYLKLTQKGELSTTGQTVIDYFLSVEASKHIAMMSGTDKGFEVRDYFLECERRALSALPAFALPDFTNPAAAARAWADAMEASQTLAIERDHAIATKAHIGDKRQATAMANTAKANREAAYRSEKLARAASSVKFASTSIDTPNCAPPPLSAVDDRINLLRGQVAALHDLVAQLIDKARPILNCDPREILDECSAPVSVSSCPLEFDLIDLSERLSRHSSLLGDAIQRIQL